MKLDCKEPLNFKGILFFFDNTFVRKYGTYSKLKYCIYFILFGIILMNTLVIPFAKCHLVYV